MTDTVRRSVFADMQLLCLRMRTVLHRMITSRFVKRNQILNMAADDQTVCIKDLRPGMKNVTCVFIVIDRG